jgi:hypothetical protein
MPILLLLLVSSERVPWSGSFPPSSGSLSSVALNIASLFVQWLLLIIVVYGTTETIYMYVRVDVVAIPVQ